MPATRPAALALAAASLLLLGGCGGSLPTNAPAGSGSAETPIETAPVASDGPRYPNVPTIGWRFTAEQVGLSTSSPALTDPNALSAPDSPPAAAVIDAGQIWVTAAQEPDHPRPTLVGIAADSGERRWTYQPPVADGELAACAAHQMNSGRLACVIATPGVPEQSTVITLDASTGQEDTRFQVPGWSTAIEVTGDDVIVLMDSVSEPATIARYSAGGAQVWSTRFTHSREGVDAGGWTYLDVTDSRAAVDLTGALRVFDLEDGLLLASDGPGEYALAADGSVALGIDDVTTGSGSVTVVRPDGSLVEVAEEGVALLTPLVAGTNRSLLVQAADGQISVLDTANGTTMATVFVIPRGAENDIVYGASILSDTLVVSAGDRLRGYRPEEPGLIAWETGHNYGQVHADGDLIYNVATPADGGPSVVQAVKPATGETVWSLDTDALGLDLVNGSLITLSYSDITRLAP